MPQGMPYPKGEMSMHGAKSMRQLMGMEKKEESKAKMTSMKGKKAMPKKMGMKYGKSK